MAIFDTEKSQKKNNNNNNIAKNYSHLIFGPDIEALT